MKSSGIAVVCTCLLVPLPAAAQGTIADYQRAMTLRARYDGLALNVVDERQWIRNTNRFWYRRSVKGGHEFILVDADAKTKQPAFDHARMAEGVSTATKGKYTALTLPFVTFTFTDEDKAIEFGFSQPNGAAPPPPGPRPMWHCSLESYTCRQAAPTGRGGRGGGNGLAGPVRAPFDINGAEPKKSPDGKLEALVNNYNIAVREPGARTLSWLTTDGSEGNYYDPESIEWSPDSARIAAYKVRPGFRRYVHYVESSRTT
jgi:hypothetical protein